jgi:arsenate reductase
VPEVIRRERYIPGRWETLDQKPAVVITVCARAAGEACPAWPGEAIRAHWGVEDPADAGGPDAMIEVAFDDAYRTLRRRIESFLSWADGVRDADPRRLAEELKRIGEEIA